MAASGRRPAEVKAVIPDADEGYRAGEAPWLLEQLSRIARIHANARERAHGYLDA